MVLLSVAVRLRRAHLRSLHVLEAFEEAMADQTALEDCRLQQLGASCRQCSPEFLAPMSAPFGSLKTLEDSADEPRRKGSLSLLDGIRSHVSS